MRTEFPPRFGALVKKLRQDSGYTREQLAQILETDSGHIRNLEDGSLEPGLGLLMCLARAFGLPFEEFAAMIEKTAKNCEAMRH